MTHPPIVLLRATPLVALLLAACSSARSAAPHGADRRETLIVLNKGEDTASFIDPATGATRGKATVGHGPHEAACSPDGRVAVVCNYGDRTPGNSLTVLDVAGARSLRTIDLGEYKRPHGIQFLGDGRRALVTSEDAGKLLVVDVESGRVERTVETQQKLSHMVAAAPAGDVAYTANIGSGSISALDLRGGAFRASVATGAGAEGIALRPGAEELWVTNGRADNVSIIDTKNLQVSGTLSAPGRPLRVAFTVDGATAIVSCAEGDALLLFDASSRALKTRIEVAAPAAPAPAGEPQRALPIGILPHPDGRCAFVAAMGADAVAVLDLSTRRIERWIHAGSGPDGMAFSTIAAP